MCVFNYSYIFVTLVNKKYIYQKDYDYILRGFLKANK